ncbi:MAG: hypothetical protein ACK5S6_00320 [bacterium]|jgi:hypothetical protein
MDWTTVVGSVMVIGAAVWSAIQWYMGRKQANNPPTVEEIAQAVLEVLKRLQEQDTPVKYGITESVKESPEAAALMSRMQAMEHIEALAGYLEAKDAAAGLEALQTVLLALVPSKTKVVSK